jgi:putative salt-induced outer membrane protein YdiY
MLRRSADALLGLALTGASLTTAQAALGHESSAACACDSDADSGASNSVEPGPSADDDWDWIELDTGEWLKGKIEEMIDGDLEFDSDSLGDQTIDWDDVVQIRSPREMNVLLDDQQTVRGRVSIKNGKLIVAGHAPIAHDNVVIMVPKRQSEIQYWSINITVGATIQSGNTEQVSYNATADLTRQSVETRFNFGYIGNYSKNLDVVTTNNQRVNTFFDYFLDKLVFLRFVQAEYYFNPFQNLDLQVTVGPGVGLQFYRKSKIKWDLVAGPAYEYTRFESVEAGQSDSSTTPAGLLTTTIATKPFSKFKLGGTYQVAFTNERSGLVTWHLLAKASYKLGNSVFEVSASGIWDRIQSPMPNSNGVRPEPNDFQLLLGFGVDY